MQIIATKKFTGLMYKKVQDYKSGAHFTLASLRINRPLLPRLLVSFTPESLAGAYVYFQWYAHKNRSFFIAVCSATLSPAWNKRSWWVCAVLSTTSNFYLRACVLVSHFVIIFTIVFAVLILIAVHYWFQCYFLWRSGARIILSCRNNSVAYI